MQKLKIFERLCPKEYTCWAVRVFNQWIEQQNKHMDATYPFDLLEKQYNSNIISECLQWFMSEARRANGTYYPPKTIYQMFLGLLCYLRENQSDPVNFLDKRKANSRSYMQLVM